MQEIIGILQAALNEKPHSDNIAEYAEAYGGMAALVKLALKRLQAQQADG